LPEWLLRILVAFLITDVPADRYRGSAHEVPGEMRIVDTHTHVWGPDTDEYPWVEPVLPPGWEGPYTHDEIIADMDAADVEGAVVVSTPLYGHKDEANAYMLNAIDTHPERLWGVAIVEWFPEVAETLADRVERLLSYERVLGVRAHAADPSPGVPADKREDATWLLEDRLERAIERIDAADETMFIFANPKQLPTLIEFAETYPDLRIAVDHMAAPEPVDPDGQWSTLERLSEADNVTVKVSSIPRASMEGWPYQDCHEHLERLLEWFGAERLMIGSDYPWLNDWANYEECLSWLEAVDFVSNRDRRLLSAQTFDRTLGT
jgi:L-fuconolactonase